MLKKLGVSGRMKPRKKGLGFGVSGLRAQGLEGSGPSGPGAEAFESQADEHGLAIGD
jgi:hypothetical protein